MKNRSNDFAFLSYEGENIQIQFRSSKHGGAGANISVLIGPNGAGKSRALAAALDEFIVIEQLCKDWVDKPRRSIKSINDDKSARIEYRISGQVFSVYRRGRNLECTRNGISCTPSELILPNKALAFAHLPVDKFRFSRNERDSFYSYFGLRQATNLTTTGALETKVILSIFKGLARNEYRAHSKNG